MKVHIVANEWENDQVLARLARILVERTGWSIGNDARPDSINYLFPYLNIPSVNNIRTGTKTVAWFTHYDCGHRSKESAWERCASTVDLRLTCAPMYLSTLAQHGPSAIVTPPVDTDKFQPAEFGPVGIVGVSGYVYKGGRKGEVVVKRLVEQSKELGIKIRASGKGWPCTTTEYVWDELHEFYQSVSVYLCTATIEGIPMPPLEAMACGVPVVIPRGVGLLDELPALQNVHRYNAGDYDGMVGALQAALAEPLNTTSLRSAVLPYSADAWVSTHVEALDAQFGSKPFAVGALPQRKGKSGVYVVAYGDPARECAQRLIKSVHKHMKGLPVAVVSDKPLTGVDIFIEHSDNDIGARGVKTQIYDLAPADWDYVLYLDADTEVVRDISFLFDLLVDGWQLAFCYNPAKYVLAAQMRRKDNDDECALTFEAIGTDQLLQYNGGVFCFRRCKETERLFRDWHTEWDKWGARDQAALDRALYAHPLRIYTLGLDWNCVTRYETPTEHTAILHFPTTARRWHGRIDGRLDVSENWASIHPGGKNYKPSR